MTTIDMGNNETRSIGIFKATGGFLAMTLVSSKTFKTRAGAVRWLRARGYDENGNRV